MAKAKHGEHKIDKWNSGKPEVQDIVLWVQSRFVRFSDRGIGQVSWENIA